VRLFCGRAARIFTTAHRAAYNALGGK